MTGDLAGDPRWRATLEMLVGKLGSGFIYTLTGGRGVGKTQLATAVLCNVARELMREDSERSIQPRYAKAAEMFRAVQGGFALRVNRRGAPARKSAAEVITNFITPKLLVIDELQEAKGSDFEDRTLTAIIDGRYDRAVDTIIITNLTTNAMGEALGPSIVSRMRECGGAIECDWPSFREAAR